MDAVRQLTGETAQVAMWHAMFAEQIPLAEKILRTVIVCALIAVLFRLTWKRGLASLSTFDVVVIFLLSNFVQNAIIAFAPGIRVPPR